MHEAERLAEAPGALDLGRQRLLEAAAVEQARQLVGRPPGARRSRAGRRSRATSRPAGPGSRSSSRSGSVNPPVAAGDRDEARRARRRACAAAARCAARWSATPRADAPTANACASTADMAASAASTSPLVTTTSSGAAGRGAPRRGRRRRRRRRLAVDRDLEQARRGRGWRRTSRRCGASRAAAARARPFRSRSRASSWRDILLNSSPSAANSSWPIVGTREAKSPAPMRRAASRKPASWRVQRAREEPARASARSA